MYSLWFLVCDMDGDLGTEIDVGEFTALVVGLPEGAFEGLSLHEGSESRSEDLESDYYGSAAAFVETNAEAILLEVGKVMELNPGADSARVLRGISYYAEGYLKMWDLTVCGLRRVPRSLVLLYTKFPYVFTLPVDVGDMEFEEDVEPVLTL